MTGTFQHYYSVSIFTRQNVESGSDTGKVVCHSDRRQALTGIIEPFVQYNNIPGAEGRFLGWWAVMTQAAFAYMCVFSCRHGVVLTQNLCSGTEIVAVRCFRPFPHTIFTFVRSLRERLRILDAIFRRRSSVFIFGASFFLCVQYKC